MLQRLWEAGIRWDDQVLCEIKASWEWWREELPELTKHLIPRCYYSHHAHIVSSQLHGFSNASEAAYAGVVYHRSLDSTSSTNTSLMISKTRVTPIKRITIPRLELWDTCLLVDLLSVVQDVLQLPSAKIYDQRRQLCISNHRTSTARTLESHEPCRESGRLCLPRCVSCWPCQSLVIVEWTSMNG